VEGTQDHVKADPSERKPACPVVAPEHIGTTHNRNKIGDLGPYDIVLKWKLQLEPSEMISGADHARQDVHESDNGHADWTFVHAFSGLPISQWWPKGLTKRPSRQPYG